ncbi:MAG: TetR/AcrR family transcriptional regulator [Eubacteriaceae bacterium]
MNKEKILNIAFEKFTEKGYQTSMGDIAKAIGIRKQSLYHYFKNKDELFLEVIHKEIREYFAQKKHEFSCLNELDIRDQLSLIFFSIIDYFEDVKKIRFWRWIMLNESNEIDMKISELIREHEIRFYHILKDIFEKGVKNGDIIDEPVENLIQMYIVMIQGILNGMLLYFTFNNRKKFINNIWNTYEKVYLNKNIREV